MATTLMNVSRKMKVPPHFRSTSWVRNAHKASSRNSIYLRRAYNLVSPRLGVNTCTSLLRPTRTFSASVSCAFPDPENEVVSFPDPERPDLFYHLYHNPPTSLSANTPVFALSFLPDPPASVDSCTIIGWLPANAHGQEEGAGLNDFVENDQFRSLLHEAVQGGLRDGVDEIQANGAIQTQQGWMHIHDNRNIPALGRIGDPDDIIASVRVEDGKIMADTYQPMPSYRLCTADGVIQLTEGLAARLMETLQAKARYAS